MTSAASTHVVPAPTWFESLLFLALMSGPPKFRYRDPSASLAGQIDSVVLIQVGVWACGGVWVLTRLFPSLLRRGIVPSVNPAQAVAALFIAALTLSVRESPGFLLTAFTLGQFAVMLGFAWVFTHRFGPSAYLRHVFGGVGILAVTIYAFAYFAPQFVTSESDFVLGQTRLQGDYIADTGSVAVIGLVLCLSNLPPLRGPMFWGAFSLFGVLLLASRTRSALIAFFVFLVIGFIYGKGLRIRKLVFPLAAVAFSVFLLDAFSSTTDYLVRERASIETMSDRIPLWQHLTNVVMREAPISGLGYYAASRIVAPQFNPGLGNAHSVFFEVLVGGGILGAALYLVLCASLIWFAMHLLWRASGQPSAVAAVGLLSVPLVMGIATSSGLQPEPLGFAFWSSTALLPALLREAARARIGVAQRYARASSVRADRVVVSPS